MPKLLFARFGAETIEEFRLSAWERFEDGNTLANHKRGTAAIYLWGYAVEMILKSAYFSLIGHGNTTPITFADLQTALGKSPASMASSLGMSPHGNFHDIAAWADLIVRYRTAYSRLYSDPTFSVNLTFHVATVARFWKETIRYHRNRAYEFEVRDVRESTTWILDRSTDI